MKLLKGLGIVLVALISVQIAAAQSSFKPGDKVIVIAQTLNVYAAPNIQSSITRAVLRGTTSVVIATQVDAQHNTWVYLLDHAIGWVQLGDPVSLVEYSDDGLAQIVSDATTTLTTNPSAVDAYLARAAAEESQSKYTAAIADFESAISFTPGQPDLYFYLTEADRNAGQWNDAQRDFHTALSLHENSARFLVLCGEIYQTLGVDQYAEMFYQNAEKAAPDYGYPYAALAVLYANMKEYTRALEFDAEALQYDPNLLFVYVNQGLTYEDMGLTNNTLERYTTLIKIAPFYADGYVKRGEWYQLVKQDIPHALADFKQAIMLDPQSDTAYDSRSVLETELGNLQDALSDAKEAVQLNMLNDHAHWTLADVYGDLGQYQQALDQYTQVINLHGYYAYAILLYRPQIDIALGDYNAALDDLSNYLEQTRNDDFDATALILRASIYARLGNYTVANADLQTLIGIQPDFAKNYNTIGKGYQVTPMRENRVLPDLQQNVADHPQDADLHLQLAQMSMEFGLWSQAYDNFEVYSHLSNITPPGFADLTATLQQLAS